MAYDNYVTTPHIKHPNEETLGISRFL